LRRARRAIRLAGTHLMFLPTYRLNLNVIVQLFAEPKHLRRAAQPRIVEATWRKAGALIYIVSPSGCSN
jgi:transposase